MKNNQQLHLIYFYERNRAVILVSICHLVSCQITWLSRRENKLMFAFD